MERRRLPHDRMLLPLIFLVLLSAKNSDQYGSGAPPRACEKMLPFHNNLKPQTSMNPYTLRPWIPIVHQGGELNVTLYSPASIAFQGFFIQARSVQDNSRVLGKWIPNPDGSSKTTDCSNPGDSVTHTSKQPKQSIVLKWTAPTDFLGAVVIRATVAQDYSTFWGGLDATLVEVVTPETVITENVVVPDTAPTSRPIPAITYPTTSKSVAVKNDPFYDGCGSTKLCFGKPNPECINNQDCEAAVTVHVAGDIYTFEVMATGSPGYVGAGLSDDKAMGDDSVMECVHLNGRTSVHTSWTYPKSDPYVSRQNVSQNIVQSQSTSYKDGVLQCKFTRDIRSTVRGRQFDLSQDKYHLMLVAGNNAEETHVRFHDRVFDSSEDMISLADPIIVGGASKLLLRLHGSFMLAAWIGTASCGILLARYYRQTWVGSQLGGKDLWFAWHRIFMVLTWLLTVSGFIIILVEVKGWAGTGDNPHAIIGIVTIILCFLQPIGAYFRPHPNTPRRPIFNWAHWFFGNAAHILGIVTIFFAVYLNKAELPGWMLYILVAFVAFHVIVHLILSITMCMSDGRINNGRVNSFPMKDFLSSNRAPVNHDRKIDAQHSGFRKLILGVYITIVILFVVAMLCLICLAPIESTIESMSKAISGDKDNN